MSVQTQQVGQRPVMDEVPVRAAGIHVSLILNRRHRVARLVDFLAGSFPQKAAAIDAVARREGIERVYTLVEKEESVGWSRVGFAREGSIPGYYKRSDAHLMGRVVSTPPLVDEDGLPMTPPADANAAERTLNQAKKLQPELTGALKGFRVALCSDESVGAEAALPPRSKKGGAWLEERFGRTGQRLHVVGRVARVGAKPAEQLLSLELQEPFGNAHLQLASWALKPDDGRMLFCALQAAAEPLRAKEIGCVFALSPADNPVTAAAFLAAGYKRTGLLSQHLLLGDRRVDAFLWTRRSVTADADAA